MSLPVSFVLHLVNTLNYGEFPFGQQCSMWCVPFLTVTHTESSTSKEYGVKSFSYSEKSIEQNKQRRDFTD